MRQRAKMNRLCWRPTSSRIRAIVENSFNLVKQLFGHISQSIVGEFTVVSLITLGTSVKKLARVLACNGELRNM